jgi:glycosyltransferase involved in cell wall biosynthesis
MNSISVVMSAYNAENTIAETIESVLIQSFSDFEFIIVNIGSAENIRSIIYSYDDKRIRVFDTDQDYIQSLNLGIKV